MGDASRAVLVAVLILLVGCGGPASAPARTGATTETTTVTPAPVPTDTPSTFLAPGVTPRGVVNPVALVAAHERALRGTSVTVRFEESRRYANGSLRWRRTATQRIDVDSDADRPIRSRYTSELRGSAPTRDLPSAFVRFPDTTRVERYTVGGGAYHRYRLRSGGVWYVGGTADEVRPLDPGLVLLFRSVETRVVGREAGAGPTRYRLSGTEVTDPAALGRALGVGRFARIGNVSFVATVDARGTVREYRLIYTLAGADGVLLRGRESARFTDLGETTVERPDWYGDAVNATGEWGGDRAEDGNDEQE
jgi:hypothetical protein